MEKTAHNDAHSAPEKTQPGPWAVAVGDWLYRNKNITANPVGYTGFQFLRSAAAAVPYGISMPVTYYGMMKLGQKGREWAQTGEGWRKIFGGHIQNFAGAKAVMASAMIATSFTCYRGTSKLANWTKQHLIDDDDTREQTIEKVHYYWSDLKNKFWEVLPAEIHSTPVAAVVLGFITTHFDIGKVPEELRWNNVKNIKNAVVGGTRPQFMRDVILNPKARFVEQAAINTIGYSLFFELGDRLFKDVQVSRYLWQGDPSNISPKAGVSDAVATLKDDQEQERQRVIDKYGKYIESHKGEVKPAVTDDKSFGFFTHEPSIGRFLFRRVLPTAVGMTAYTALKMRHSYMWLGGPFPEISSLKDIPKNAWREGAAVTLFFLIPLVSDPWARVYDNFFEKLENWVKGKQPEDAPTAAPEDARRIANNNEKLLEKVNSKEKGMAR